MGVGRPKCGLPCSARPILPPPSRSHILLNRTPHLLYNLSVPPPPRATLDAVPLVDLDADDATAPALDHRRRLLTLPADVDAQDVRKQLCWLRPLVALELPCLAGGEDSDDARPVVGLELVGSVDEDEAERARGVD